MSAIRVLALSYLFFTRAQWCGTTTVSTTEVQNFTEIHSDYDVGLEMTTMEGRQLKPSATWGYKLGVRMNIAWMPFILLLGWIGNAMSLAVFSRPKNRSISCCVYMCGLAVSDSCLMFVATHYYWRYVDVIFLRPRDMTTYKSPAWECSMFVWLYNFASLSGVCIIISMTVDRFIGVMFPLLAMRLCTPTRAKRVMIAIPFLTGAYTIPYLLYSKLVGPTCTALAVKSTFTIVYSWMTICLNSLIPFVCLLSLNTAIIIVVRQAKSQVKKTQSTKSTSRENQMVFLLLMVSFTFLLLTLPLYARYLTYQYIDQFTSEQTLSDFYVYFHVTNKMFYTNNAVNFLLYCIGGSKFRKDLRNLCVCSKKTKNEKKPKTSIYSTESTIG